MNGGRIRRILSQAVFNVLLRTSGDGRASRIARRLLQRVRQAMVVRGDPPVRFRLGARQIWIPVSHELPFYLARHREYARAIGRIAALTAEHIPNMSFIDVGANVGDTVTLVREEAQFPILCVEGDPLFAGFLRRNVASLADVTIAEALIDESGGIPEGHLERGGGSARLVPGPRSGPTAVSLGDLLESYPRFADPTVIKVDTDGMDARILGGALPLIERSHPILFFEYDPDLAEGVGSNLRKLMLDLAAVGYETALIFENTGEYRTSIRITDPEQREALHTRYSGFQGRQYADVCVFPRDREDLAAAARAQEIHRSNAREAA